MRGLCPYVCAVAADAPISLICLLYRVLWGLSVMAATVKIEGMVYEAKEVL